MVQPADQWWFWRGAQSALFFYISCGPCYSAAYRRKRKREAVRAKKQKELLQMEQPDLYHHPAPFEINPHWQEEIRLGPGPPPRRTRNRTRDSNHSAGRHITTAGTQSTLCSHASSTVDLGPQRHPAHSLGGQGWNKKRYHRPDEEFVEIDDDNDDDDDDIEGKKVHPTGWTISKPEQAHYSARAPPVNELHPPVVSTPPSHWKDRKWMTAPPPSAEFMQGKKGVTSISRNASRASVHKGTSVNTTPTPSPALRPVISERPRANNLEAPTVSTAISRKSSSRLSTRQERTDSLTAPTENSLDEPLRGRRKSRPPPIRIDSSSSDESDFTDPGALIAKPKPTCNRKSAARTRRRKPAQVVVSANPAIRSNNDSDDYENLSLATASAIVSPALTARSHGTADTVSPFGSPCIRPLSTLTNSATNTTTLTQPSLSPASPTHQHHDALWKRKSAAAVAPSQRPAASAAFAIPLPDADSKEFLALVDGDVSIEELWLGERRWGAASNKRWSTDF